VADIYLEEMDTRHIFVTDVMITFPNQHDPRTTDEPLSAANRGGLAKYTRFVPDYSIAQEDVIPLVLKHTGLRSCHFRIPQADNVDDCK